MPAMSAGVDEHAGLGRYELRWPAVRRADDAALHRHRLEQRLAERLGERRLAEDVAGGDPAPNLGMGDAPDDPHPLSALEGASQRPVADERQPPAAELRRRHRRARPRSCARSASRRTGKPAPRPPSRARAAPRPPPRSGRRRRGRSRSWRSRASPPQPAPGPPAAPPSQREFAITPPARPTTQRVAARTPGIAAEVGDVLAVRHHHEPRARPARAASAPAAPAGKSMWAKTTSGRLRRAARARLAASAAGTCSDRRRGGRSRRPRPRSERLELAHAPAPGRRRSPGPRDPATSG